MLRLSRCLAISRLHSTSPSLLLTRRSSASSAAVPTSGMPTAIKPKLLEYQLHGAGLNQLADHLHSTRPRWVSSLLAGLSQALPLTQNTYQMQVAKDIYVHLDKLNSDVLEYFYGQPCKMPFTFQSWFAITQLHVWMCQARLRSEGEKKLAHHLLDHLTTDIELKMRACGVDNPILHNRTLMELLSFHYGCSLAYDEGFEQDDAILASALWRNMYLMGDDVNMEQLVNMSTYVRFQMHQLYQMDLAEFARADFKWSLPDMHK